MNNCSICGEEEYSITANGDIHKHELCRKKGVKNGKRD